MIYRKLFLAAALAAAPVASLHAADVQIVAQNPVIELSVSEQVNSAPDTASFSTGVETKAPTATQALRDNSRMAKTVIDKLKSLGIEDKDIQTTGISLNADYQYDRASEQNRFVGYRVSNQVSATVRDIEKLGMILDALVSQGGATNLNGPYFSVDDDSELKKLARERALANARMQALSYANAEGYAGVRVLSISEGLSNVSQGPMPQMRGMVADAVQDLPISVGQVGTTINLSITYEMVR
ncbi:SIMPL domain-containing protein [Parasphingorhabdus halotolerans]|uniref:SIMPL domain-containing protein n=1 Tax=Parasphingorhabdus halotolerans TaxID=2725558 RepID=A0A6H2DRY3_9SPHN|nr:SIMPL domain-containing protein [Parasphingorhabdus halotolerans]QJB70521.1 SIMPL domain-containing protein [Parasphingorhabdus halotolerans]